VVLIELESWELQVLGTVPLIKLSLVTKSFRVIFDIALKAGVTRVTADELHSLEQEIMLVHVGHKLECHLYLLERVTNDSIISTAACISTCVLAARRFLNKLSHS
jgi:hypothetical protein